MKKPNTEGMEGFSVILDRNGPILKTKSYLLYIFLKKLALCKMKIKEKEKYNLSLFIINSLMTISLVCIFNFSAQNLVEKVKMF